MNADTKTLDAIFGMTRQLVVPLFQRPYVWTEEKNWLPLWEAIQEVADTRLHHDNARPHFLGAIVLDQTPTATGDIETRQIIDGQQRLTTLQLFMAAARDAAARAGAGDYERTFEDFTRNRVPGSVRKTDAYKVWPTNRDRDDFRRVLDARSPAAVRQAYGAKPSASRVGAGIADAYMFFSERLEEWLAEGKDAGSAEERLKALYRTLVSGLLLVVIDLGDDDDAQLIFETLNALGQPLLPADLVKNFLFHQAERAKEPVEELYEEYWAGFDEEKSFWRSEATQGRLKRPRLDLFLQHYLTLRRAAVVGATHLFAEYRELWRRMAGAKPSEEIRRLREYAMTYHRIEHTARGTPEGEFLHRLRALDTAMVYPLLLEGFREGFDSNERQRILEIVESYLFRRAICCHTTKAYNRTFADLIAHLAERGFRASEARSFLAGLDGDSAVWPTDDAVRRAITQYKVYAIMRRAVLAAVLEALDRAMRDGKSERVWIDDALTVEHIMPQKWEEHWPLPSGSDPKHAEARSDVVQRFGNLTLVTGKLNPSMSNDGWESKRKSLEQHSVLTMNRRLCAEAEWDEARIEKRGTELAEIAIRRWPRTF